MVPHPDYPYPEYEYLDFTFSSFGKPEINAATIRIPVRNLWVIKGFPGYTQNVLYAECILVLTNVIRSERTVSEHISPESKEFKPAYTITDGPFPEVNQMLFLIYLGGPIHDPPGWIEWYIVAPSVQIEETESDWGV